jgi:ABC-type amino acid transport substrate-binding protein
MVMKNLTRMMAMTVSLALLSSACGGGGSDNELANIQEKGVWVIGTSGNNKPTIFRDPSGELVGMDADWANRIAKHLGVKVEWEVLDFKGIIPGLQAKQFDAAMSGLRVTEERKAAIDFSDPIGADEAVAVYKAGTPGIKSPEDISGKTVCVVAGSSNGEEPVKRIGTAKKVQAYPGQAEAFADLANGRCEVMVTGRLLAADWRKSGEGEGFEISVDGTDCAALAVGFPKGSEELLEAVNEAIQQERDAGAYEEVAKEWMGEPFPVCAE